jgi:acyl-CoA thioester hydrolase
MTTDISQDFSVSFRVYVEDTDYGGFVYHANYLRFMERARNEWCLARGLQLEEWAKKNVLFVVKTAQLDYLRAARFNEVLEVVTRVIKISRVSITYEQIVRRLAAPEEVFCQGEIMIVCIDSQRMKAQPMPKDLWAMINSF